MFKLNGKTESLIKSNILKSILENRNMSNYNKLINFKQIRNFSLYIPYKKLLFVNHIKYGRVYPVYIADSSYNKKNDPKKLMPFILLFTSFNLFIFLTGMQLIPITKIYQSFYSSELAFLTTVFINVYLLKKYFKYLSNFTNRVRCMYLFPSGNKILLESFSGSTSRFDNLDIYNYNIKNYNKEKVKSIFINNHNNFKASIQWGRNKENYFEGKRIILDYEIFSNIIKRFNIDTTITKYRKEMLIGHYSTEDKRKIIRKYSNKKYSVSRIDKNRLFYHYVNLRRSNLKKKKKDEIKEEFKFY
jgi:hypothetical protein